MTTLRRILGLVSAAVVGLVLLAPVWADRTGSQAKHLPTPGGVPPRPGDPANSYRWGPGHSTGRTGTNSPFGPGAQPGPQQPQRIYFIKGLGTKKVGAWYVENDKATRIDAEMQRKSDGKDKNGNNRAFTPWEQAFDGITGLRWNWIGSSRSGGVEINAGAVGDVNVPPVNNFDDIAKWHDVQSWIDSNFAFGELVMVSINGRWVGYTKDLFTHLTVVKLFVNEALNTLNRARDTALQYGALLFAVQAEELKLKLGVGIARANLKLLGDVLPTLFGEAEYRRYMTGEFPRSMKDFARRLRLNQPLREASAALLGVPEKDVLSTFIDPNTRPINGGKVWETYVINREGGYDLNRIKDNFPLIDMVARNGRFVSIAFGKPGYYERKFKYLLDPKKLRSAVAELKTSAARLPRGTTVPANECQLLQKIQLCVCTAADAEELRGYVRRRIQKHGLTGWGKEIYSLMQQAWGSDDAIERNLLGLVRGPA